MKKRTLLYYFSATGNSLAAARQIAARIPGSRLVKITGDTEIVAGERIGFVYPCYFGQMPKLVRGLLERMDVNPATYYFAVVTAGLSGNTAYVLADEILKKKGAKLSYGRSVAMPRTYIAEYKIEKHEKIEKKVAAAKTRLDAIAFEIAEETKIKIPWFKFYANNLYKNPEQLDNQFYTEESCTGCGTCSRVCPMDNIRIADGKPQWQHRCDHCMACIHWCPGEAIQYGSKTAQRGRYHHPGITLADITGA